MEKKISYLDRTFDEYKNDLIELSKKYYPNLSTSFNDASVASWIIDLMASIADSEAFHLDRVYQETNIDSANELGSLMAIARNKGLKIPGPKGAMAEMKISIILPVSSNEPDWSIAPIIKRGTKFASGSQEFELLNDVDFASQFDNDGNSDRTITANKNTNGIIIGYTISKLAVVIAGESRVYRQILTTSDIKPFMEIILPVENVMNVESILVLDGINNTLSPSYGEFYGSGCSNVIRFYEVDNLAQGWSWLDKIGNNGKAVTYNYKTSINSATTVDSYYISRGEWRPVEHKFITEYTDNGYLKIIFGSGDGNIELDSNMSDFSKAQMSRILNSNALGVLPKANSTLFVLYRIGGGKSSNVAKGAINRISYLNADFRGNDKEKASAVMSSISVENTTPSVSGKDMPSEKEIRQLIKYHNAAQERCVTVKDYIDRILLLPPKYGTPFRVGAMEENNKIMIYLLGINNEGKLDTSLPLTLVKNIENYLSAYKMINDYIEIKNGRIINLSFDVEAIIDKNYNKTDVVNSIINTIESYMDINKHLMGEEIYVGDLEKEISKIDGVINLIGLKIFNEIGEGYSQTQIGQEIISEVSFSDENMDYVSTEDSKLIDLEATDGILYNDGDTMMEIKYPEKDIRIKIKER